MADAININVDSPKVDAPVEVKFTGQSIVDSIRNGINELIDNIKKGSDEALTVVFVGTMFFTVGLYFWRRV
tara:strand:- start:1133 stop:1345 length:213 start_codon:yes stop_codon:yes gene_type:complete